MVTGISRSRAERVYSLLVSIGGAAEMMRGAFVSTHAEGDCQEWRFGGKLGFGGKYRAERNQVDYYSEDDVPETRAVARELNEALAKLK